ncbi:MAG: transglutaminase-like enzyme predicted cysteine protease [Phycisphaerales bacterium]|jgi:transglutaminase-like putative cysteine protease|nr:transglutaminase-like enzyme predicted cysteine protease [Phycisphaerales bacterium]
MRIRIGYDIIFNLPAPTPMHLMLYVHPTRFPTLRGPEALRIDPYVPTSLYVDDFGNTCGRIVAMAGQVRFTNEAVVEDSGMPDAFDPSAQQHLVDDLPAEVLRFLLSSRYCEVDLLKDTAGSLFTHARPGWDRVHAICDWVHSNVRFGYEFASATKSAVDVYRERRGVCRDFMHLAITFCRAMNIPARYATGYLGDIGVPISPAAMDFSAWFEVYLGGKWWTMDARHNQRRIGRVLMARGRDAVDVALTTAFGVANLLQFNVVTEEIRSY